MKPLSNPYLARIASLTGEKDPCRALPLFVEGHRRCDESLEDLARKYGVSRIIQERMAYEGGLFKLAGGELVIKLNSDSSFVRKRFTLAHELGHLLLETIPAYRSSNRTDAALERTCDMIAAELLMPGGEVTQFVRSGGPPSPVKLRDTATKYGVSIQTAAIRIRGLRLWNCSIAMWDCSPNVRTLWSVGPKKLASFRPTLKCLVQAVTSECSIKVQDFLLEMDCTEKLWLDLFRVGGTRVVGLIDFVRRKPVTA